MKLYHWLAIGGAGFFLALAGSAAADMMFPEAPGTRQRPATLSNTPAASTTALTADGPFAGEDQAEALRDGGNTGAAEAKYIANQSWQDFEVHLFIALPFAALYSYLTVLSLDGIVQNQFPPEFRQADVWVVMGLAAGSAFAVALGSIGRVADQSVPRTAAEESPLGAEDRHGPPGNVAKIAALQICF